MQAMKAWQIRLDEWPFIPTDDKARILGFERVVSRVKAVQDYDADRSRRAAEGRRRAEELYGG